MRPPSRRDAGISRVGWFGLASLLSLSILAGYSLPMGNELYGADFFSQIRRESGRSARTVVPILMHLLQPRSVVDVGCGDGQWLAEFARAGVSDHFGIDGASLTPAHLHNRFRQADLAGPVVMERRFDLAISLEVAEHLPDSAAAGFIESLTNLAPVVVFSAAIPGQGGTGHINEQWQDYWREKFAARGFLATDAIRPKIWRYRQVADYYQQNMILYAPSDRLAALGLAPSGEESLNLRLTAALQKALRYPTVSEFASMVPRIIWDSLSYHLHPKH